MKKRYIAIIVFVVSITVGFLLYPKPIHNNGDTDTSYTKSVNTVVINNTAFNVDIADNDTDRANGLSGRKFLSDGAGLLFIFDNPGIYPFWMKDMNFPIDIIWIDENLKVVYIKENALPESYPEIFNPNIKAMYVLEVNSGEVGLNKIKIGDDVVLNIQ